MDIMRLIEERHSVRRYKQVPIEEEKRQAILGYLTELNEKSGLDIRLVDNGEKVFGGALMKLVGWKYPPMSCFEFVGEKTPENEIKCGYYGEELVLFVQSLGLNTCWVGMFKKSETEDNTLITIAVGYGEDGGKARRSKSVEQVSCYEGDMPKWFEDGVKCALLAPTAINKQGFNIKGEGNRVKISYGGGIFSNVDLGIVKYHFEQGAGKENFEWA